MNSCSVTLRLEAREYVRQIFGNGDAEEVIPSMVSLDRNFFPLHFFVSLFRAAETNAEYPNSHICLELDESRNGMNPQENWAGEKFPKSNEKKRSKFVPGRPFL